MGKLFYIASDGERQDPETMHLAKFDNSIKKIERLGPSGPNWKNLEALKAIYAERKEMWDAEHPKEA